MKSILDPSFKYVPASHTDIRETFKRIRAELLTTQREGEQKPARKADTSKRLRLAESR